MTPGFSLLQGNPGFKRNITGDGIVVRESPATTRAARSRG